MTCLLRCFACCKPHWQPVERTVHRAFTDNHRKLGERIMGRLLAFIGGFIAGSVMMYAAQAQLQEDSEVDPPQDYGPALNDAGGGPDETP